MFILECLNSSPFLAGQAPDRKEVCLRTGRVPQNGPDHRAAFHRRTVAAGLVPLLRNTPANAAHAATIGEFHPFGTTSHAIDGRGRNLRSPVHHAPSPAARRHSTAWPCGHRTPRNPGRNMQSTRYSCSLRTHLPSSIRAPDRPPPRLPTHSENHSGIKCSGRPSEFFFSFDRISNRSYSVHAGVAIV